jgi:penicillin G amidase
MLSTRFLISLILTVALTISFNLKIGPLPPLGKFFSPHHGFWQNAENAPISAPESLALPGLISPVTIYFDDLLIPHIYAQNEADLFYAQGYITAFHRLWQMEFQLMATAGRVSEIIGDRALDYDRGRRREGLAYGARQAEEEMKNNDPALYALLESYAAGVNAYINSLSYRNLPIEYKLLDYRPEPWTASKCFLLGREMADQLSRDEMDLEHSNALALWGMDIFKLLYPERHPGLDPVIPRGTKWNFNPIEVPLPTGEYPKILTKGELRDAEVQIGSNSFVVNGQKTANGKTIFTNETDLGMNLPCIWYLAHLNSPGLNAFGGTLPGAPGVVIGFNDSIAWGNTNAKRDVVDWYTIEFRDKTRDEYKYGNKWLKTKKVVEAFKVRNGKTFYDTIIFTHYGPVSYDSNFPKGERKDLNLAMRWTAHDPSMEIKTLYLVNKARNYDEFVQAFDYFTGPPQNYSFADVTGDIALWIHGKFPVKWPGQGKFILDGTNPSHEWQAMMPKEHNFNIKNPKQNFVSSANQHPGDSLYPYYAFDYNYEYYRNRRINDRLRLMSNITVEDMMKLQHDNFYYKASESLPLMLAALDTSNFNERHWSYYNSLSTWDYFAEPHRTEPTLYEIWWRGLYKKIWDEFENRQLALYRPSSFNTIYLMIKYPDFQFFDIVSSPEKETLTDVIRITFNESVDELDKWKKENGEYKWYQYKNSTVQHLLRIKPFSKEQVPVGGNGGIVNAASERHGPSWRMVVELGEGRVQAWGSYPGGQPGNPGNPHYTELLDYWTTGKYYQMLFQPEVKGHERIVFVQTLNPAN